jgi:hypothetical protein
MEKDDILALIIVIFILPVIIFMIFEIGHEIGYDEAYNDIKKELIKIKCGEYDRNNGEFKIINLLDKNQTK